MRDHAAHAAARALARARLERAAEKAVPLLAAADKDPSATVANEEVHDFRVALRRLRSWLRAADGLLTDDVGRAERAALRRLARRAGVARDAQVEWQWLTASAQRFSAPARRAAAWLAHQRLADYAAARRKLQARAGRDWPPLAEALTGALAPSPSTLSRHVPRADVVTLGDFVVPELVRHLQDAQQALGQVQHHSQQAVIHRARIEIKRLRYLIEAVAADTRAGQRAIRLLRQLQDALGDVHDAHVMEGELEPLLAVPRGRSRTGTRPALRDLRALRAALRRRELAAYRRAMAQADAAAMRALWRDPAAVAHALLWDRSPRQLARRAPATARSS